MKIVECEGIEYSVPEWAGYITRDEGQSDVYAWEFKPTIGRSGEYWRLLSIPNEHHGRVVEVERATTTDAFIKKI